MPIRNCTQAAQSRTGKFGKASKASMTMRQEIDGRYRKAIRRSVKRRGKNAQWYALRVRPGKEILDGYRMVRAGFAVFVLFGKVHRRANRFSKDKIVRYFNVSPGYVLFGVPDAMDGHKALSALGFIGRVVGGEEGTGRVARINPDDIERWADNENIPGFHAPDAHAEMITHREFSVGDKVEVLAGPFTGHILTAKDVGRKLTSAELMFFGSLRMVLVPNAQLARVE